MLAFCFCLDYGCSCSAPPPVSRLHRPSGHNQCESWCCEEVSPVVQHGWVQLLMRRWILFCFPKGEYMMDKNFSIQPREPLLEKQFPRPLGKTSFIKTSYSSGNLSPYSETSCNYFCSGKRWLRQWLVWGPIWEGLWTGETLIFDIWMKITIEPVAD